MATILENEVEKSSRSHMSYTAFLARLIDEEGTNKTDRSINDRIAKARFPKVMTFESSVFSFQSSLPAA